MMHNRLRILWMVAAAVFAVSGVSAAITKDDALSAFVSAGLAYKDGRYDEAVDKYTKIIDGGMESGAVYYNLGNSYFRNGDLGRAVLNFERARRLIPRDSDLNFNYRYALSRVEHSGDVSDVPFLRRIVGNFIGFTTVDEMAIIIAVAAVLLGAFVLTALSRHWPRAILRWVSLALAFVVALYAWGLIVKTEQQRDRAVIVTAAEAAFEPREDSTVHFNLPEGASVRIVGKEYNWLKIERLDGKAGWVPKDVLERI